VSYLVRVYAWRLILAREGILNWGLDQLGLGSTNVAYSNTAMWIVFSYLWLPFMILPVWAAIERVPNSLLEASADMGASAFTTVRRVLLPLILPGLAAGSIFTFSLTLGDFITPTLVGGAGSDFIGNVVYRSVGVSQRRALRRGVRGRARRRHGHLPPARAAPRRLRGAVTRRLLAAWTVAIALFLAAPILLIGLYAFNPSNVQGWPIGAWSTKWFSSTFSNHEMRAALWLSVKAALLSTGIALALGTLASFAVHRFHLFGREAVSLPADPAARAARDHHRHGLNSFFGSAASPSHWRRSSSDTPPSASWSSTTTSSLACAARRARWSRRRWTFGADGLTTFRLVTLPLISTASSAARCSPSRCPSTR